MVASTEDGGKSIAAVPLGHVLLMPRSLFVLTGSLYTSHLHGIEARDRDSFIAPPRAELTSGDDITEASTGGDVVEQADGVGKAEADAAAGVAKGAPERGTLATLPHSTNKAKAEACIVANATLLGLDALPRDAYTYERGTRVSLTFRHAKRVLKGGAFGVTIGGGFKRG